MLISCLCVELGQPLLVKKLLAEVVFDNLNCSSLSKACSIISDFKILSQQGMIILPRQEILLHRLSKGFLQYPFLNLEAFYDLLKSRKIHLWSNNFPAKTHFYFCKVIESQRLQDPESYTVKIGQQFSHPQLGCHCLNSPWPGLI